MSKEEEFDVGERWLFMEEVFVTSKWKKYFSQVDFETGTLTLFKTSDKTKTVKTFVLKGSEFYDAVKTKRRPCTIKVSVPQKNNKPPKFYFFSATTLRSIDEFKVELEEIDCTFEGLDKTSSGLLCKCIKNDFLLSKGGATIKLENVDVSKWSKKDVLHWLNLIKLSKACYTFFDENDIDGTILEELDATTLGNIGITDKDVVEHLLSEVQRLKNNRTFSTSRFAVRSKIERFPGYNPESKEFQDMIDSICDVSLLKHKFLSTASLQKYAFGQKGKEKVNIRKLRDMPKNVEEFKNAKIKVKIVVTEILHSKSAKNIRKFVSPFISNFVPTEFGFFHTALIVGPWYLEWTDTELVIPKRMVSGRAIITADVDTLIVPEEGLKEISDKISEVVVKWNTKFKYKNKSSKGESGESGNCQDFVDDILQALGIEVSFDGALGEFISRMRKQGKCVLEFCPNDKFRNHFGIKDKSWVFKSHMELDNFCIGLKKECLDVYLTFPSEWALLKSFDRAFWLRHLKTPEDERYLPLPVKVKTLKPWETGCPFKHPYATKTFVK